MNIKRISILLLSAVLILGSLTGCAEDERIYYNDGDDIHPAYNQLAEETRELYTTMYGMLINGQMTLTIEDWDYDSITAAYTAIVKDHPELFWLNEGCTIETSSEEDSYSYGTTSVITPMLNFDLGEISEKNSTFRSILNPLIEEAKTFASTYEKVLYVHDYLVNNTEYDSDEAAIIAANENGEGGVRSEAATAYGCIVNKKAVCSGYSAAFQAMMNMLDIKCGRIAGSDLAGNSHEWNYVYIQGEYYFVDVTWDDPSTENGTSVLSHEYLLVTEDEILKTHRIDGGQYYPDCQYSDMNYHNYNNLYVDEYTFDAVSAIINRETAEGNTAVEIKFGSVAEQRKAFSELIEDRRIFEFDAFKSGVSYTVSSSETVLIFTAAANAQ